METLALAFTMNDAYAAYLPVTLYSIFESNPQHTFAIYVLSLHLSQESKDSCLSLTKHYPNVEIAFITIDDNRFNDSLDVAHLSIETYLRFVLADVLPDVSKVLYLDVDTVVNGDLLPFWQTELGDSYALAGAIDKWVETQCADYILGKGYDLSNYINAGAVLINLDYWRTHHVGDQLFTFVNQQEQLQFLDQDALNFVLSDAIKLVPRQYNFTNADAHYYPQEDWTIRHYTGATKPWHLFLESDFYTLTYHKAYQKIKGQTDKISIIIPVYNAESFLHQCIESILTQTYSNFELILVNDGSSDTSAEICDAYARQDKRIHVIHKENGGQADARNVGIAKASGDFITFVDCDDWVETFMLEDLHRVMVEQEADMVVADYVTFKHGTGIYGFYSHNTENIETITALDCISRFSQGKNIMITPWGKLYRMSLLRSENYLFQFPKGKTIEDLPSIPKLYLHSKKTVFYDKGVYIYRLREDSFTFRKKDNQMVKDLVDAFRELIINFSISGHDVAPILDFYHQVLLSAKTDLETAIDNPDQYFYHFVLEQLALFSDNKFSS